RRVASPSGNRLPARYENIASCIKSSPKKTQPETGKIYVQVLNFAKRYTSEERSAGPLWSWLSLWRCRGCSTCSNGDGPAMDSLIAALSGDFLGTPVYFWAAFIIVVVGLLVFDLGILHRDEHEIEAKESLLL